jgi:hypothetical protein
MFAYTVGGCDKLLCPGRFFGTFAHGTIPAGHLERIRGRTMKMAKTTKSAKN